MSELVNKFNDIYIKYQNLDSKNLDKVNNILDRIILDFNMSKDCPNIILTRALYEDEKSKEFKKGKFVIRPTIAYNLKIIDIKNSFVIINDKDFFKVFIDYIVNWVESYTFYFKLSKNLEKLNSLISDILLDCNFPYSISFTIGNGICDISDDNICLGLNEDIVLNIEDLPFFSEDESWKQIYINKFINVLKECNRPYDIVKIKSDITKDLNIYNRKSINKLLRKFVSRNINYVRVGVGYVESEDTFALIERKAISLEEIKDYDLNSVIISDNLNPTLLEKKKNLVKIVTKYKLMPFEKKTNILIDMNIKDYFNMIDKEIDVK